MPAPSVPITAAGCPCFDSSRPSHCVHEVLPLVPVTAMVVIARSGLP
jgi:hypothetical protein